MKSSLENTGVSLETRTRIQAVFERFPGVHLVKLYGSRAKGNYHPGSDIDLTIMGDEVSFSQLLKIENELDALSLPYQIDLSLYRQIENEDLVEHIQRVGIDFYRRQKDADVELHRKKLST